MKSEQDYINDIQAQKKKIQELAKQREGLYGDIAATHDNMEQATKELKAEIQRIEKPFRDSIKRLEEQQKKAEGDGYEAQREIRLIEADIRLIPARDSEGYPTAESFKAFLIKNGVHGFISGFPRSSITMIQKRLPNGVALFRHGDGSDNPSFSAYYAVKGKDIVGFHFTEKARHPGDEATPNGWVGQKLMRAKNVLKVLRTNEYAKSTYECVAAFKEWKEAMSNQMLTFVALDMSDEVNRELLSEDYRISFNDKLEKIFYEE
jgi:hypothetical protein